jgi:hypothetical protein
LQHRTASIEVHIYVSFTLSQSREKNWYHREGEPANEEELGAMQKRVVVEEK